MKEIQFIKSNKDRWQTYEQPTNNPDELADRFINLIDDLGYAKTHYPLSNTVHYLNSLASNLYLSIYSNRKKPTKSWKVFLLEEIPLVIFRQRKSLLFAVVFFMVLYLIGIFLSQKDPNYIRAVLGDDYVNMTHENIAKGKPFGVYASMNQLVMYFMIAWNNIRVALLTFCSGIVFILGSLFFLFQNGIMVGTFHQMFIEKGLGVNWGLIVMIHGTLELFSIAIAGGCGIMLGSGLLFPGTYTRLQSIKQSAKDALKIMMVVVFMLLIAALFESFVTRYEHMPIWLNIPILMASVGFIVWYFVVLPIKAYKVNNQALEEMKNDFLRFKHS